MKKGFSSYQTFHQFEEETKWRRASRKNKTSLKYGRQIPVNQSTKPAVESFHQLQPFYFLCITHTRHRLIPPCPSPVKGSYRHISSNCTISSTDSSFGCSLHWATNPYLQLLVLLTSFIHSDWKFSLPEVYVKPKLFSSSKVPGKTIWLFLKKQSERFAHVDNVLKPLYWEKSVVPVWSRDLLFSRRTAEMLLVLILVTTNCFWACDKSLGKDLYLQCSL